MSPTGITVCEVYLGIPAWRMLLGEVRLLDPALATPARL